MRLLQGSSDDPRGFGSLAVSRVFLLKFFVSFRIHYKRHNYISFSSLIEHISYKWWFTAQMQEVAERRPCAVAARLFIPEPHHPPAPQHFTCHHLSPVCAWFGALPEPHKSTRKVDVRVSPKLSFRVQRSPCREFGMLSWKITEGTIFPNWELLSICDCYNSLLRNKHWIRPLLTTLVKIVKGTG